MSVPHFGDIYLIDSPGGAPEPRLTSPATSTSPFSPTSCLPFCCIQPNSCLTPGAASSSSFPARGGAQRALLDRVFAISRDRLRDHLASLDQATVEDARAAPDQDLLGIRRVASLPPSAGYHPRRQRARPVMSAKPGARARLCRRARGQSHSTWNATSAVRC